MILTFWDQLNQKKKAASDDEKSCEKRSPWTCLKKQGRHNVCWDFCQTRQKAIEEWISTQIGGV